MKLAFTGDKTSQSVVTCISSYDNHSIDGFALRIYSWLTACITTDSLTGRFLPVSSLKPVWRALCRAEQSRTHQASNPRLLHTQPAFLAAQKSARLQKIYTNIIFIVFKRIHLHKIYNCHVNKANILINTKHTSQARSNVPQCMPIDLCDLTSWWTLTASSGSTCWPFMNDL